MVHVIVNDFAAVEKKLSFILCSNAVNNSDEGGFSGAVWPKQPENAAFGNFHAYIIQGKMAGELFPDFFCR
jgi:hypothetical protein